MGKEHGAQSQDSLRVKPALLLRVSPVLSAQLGAQEECKNKCRASIVSSTKWNGSVNFF
jgi:hypothetical protein